MSSRPRVFQLITALQYGGAENMVVDLVDNIDDIDFTVGYMEQENDLVPDILETGATVKSFAERFRFDPRAFSRLRRFINSESFDIIHAHLPYAQTIGRIASSNTDINAIISTQHNIPDNYHPVTRMTERLTRPLDSTTVAVSNGVERSFTGTTHPPNELGDSWCTIYNGIDVEKFNQNVNLADKNRINRDLNLDPDALTLLNIGRYVPVKRQREAIQAVAQANFDMNLLIVGDGPLKEELRSLTRQLGVSNQVRITGRVPEVHPYYAVSDVFVSPSRGEGLPITLLEAMAAELPVVATDIPGIREVVDDGNTGMLFCPGDISELLAKIEQLREADLRRSYSDSGYQRVEDIFSVKRMAQSYSDLYMRKI